MPLEEERALQAEMMCAKALRYKIFGGKCRLLLMVREGHVGSPQSISLADGTVIPTAHRGDGVHSEWYCHRPHGTQYALHKSMLLDRGQWSCKVHKNH